MAAKKDLAEGLYGPINRPKITPDWLGGPKPTGIDAANECLRAAEDALRAASQDHSLVEGTVPSDKRDPDFFRRFQAAALFHAYDIIVALIGHESEVRALIKGRNEAARAENLRRQAEAKERRR